MADPLPAFIASYMLHVICCIYHDPGQVMQGSTCTRPHSA